MFLPFAVCRGKIVDVLNFRLWQDAQNRVYLIKELDRRTGQVSTRDLALLFSSGTIHLCCLLKSPINSLVHVIQGQSAISVDDTLKVVACR